VLQRIETFVREHGLIAPGGEVAVLVSGGADSTCLWHVLRELGYAVSAVHVAHGLRGAESDDDARFCREALGARVVELSCCQQLSRSAGSNPSVGGDSCCQQLSPSEAALRELRYAATAGPGLRATGHTASDQVESVLLGLVASGSPQRIKAKREDGVVRPLLGIWREETRAWLDERRLAYRDDSSNAGTKRGLIRDEILPLLERLDPRARASLLALADERPRLPRTLERTLARLLEGRDGTKAADLGGGVRAVREYGTLRLEGTVEWGPWTLEPHRPGLAVRGRRPGDRLAGRAKKVQDLLVDAKVPRAERDAWPLVVSGNEVVAVPGVAEAPGWEGAVTWRR
jgi:tRNA(Ile)-lysidine synthase